MYVTLYTIERKHEKIPLIIKHCQLCNKLYHYHESSRHVYNHENKSLYHHQLFYLYSEYLLGTGMTIFSFVNGIKRAYECVDS